MAQQPIRWGILGPGRIAHAFVEGMKVVPDARCVAVGSREKSRGEAFARQYDIPHVHEGYDALVADAEVDVIYIATPHPFHAEQCRLCLAGGKAVLCEKPLTVNAAEAEGVVAMAGEAGVFLMEAMWTRFLPSLCRVRKWLADGRIGEPRLVDCSFGFRNEWLPEQRWLNPALAGGALLDVGVYCIAMASMVFGPEPTAVHGSAHLGETGVDEQAAFTLGYENGAVASLSCAVRTALQNRCMIYGTEGRIEIPEPFFCSPRAILSAGDKQEVFDLPHEANGYEYEVASVQRRLREHDLENDVMPLADSLAIMRTMDTLRKQWGLTYPME